MKYLGLDVHTGSTVWCLLDEDGEVLERGKVPTTAPALRELVERLIAQHAQVTAAQESGKMSYFVHDCLSVTAAKLLTFNPHHLRMIAASRKKSDRRDAYWLAKTLQTGLTPHPVYMPTGELRRVRALLSERQTVIDARKRWNIRAAALLAAAGHRDVRTKGQGWLQRLMNHPDGIEEHLLESLERCGRMVSALTSEVKALERQLHQEARRIEVVKRLQTIPAVGELVALTIYAWVGDVHRFQTARQLCAYAGLVPTVRQSGNTAVHGHITKQGSKQLRAVLAQAGHVLLWRCTSAEAAPLRAKALRVAETTSRRKIAVVAAGRHILRTAFYVMRDQQDYNPALLQAA